MFHPEKPRLLRAACDLEHQVAPINKTRLIVTPASSNSLDLFPHTCLHVYDVFQIESVDGPSWTRISQREGCFQLKWTKAIGPMNKACLAAAPHHHSFSGRVSWGWVGNDIKSARLCSQVSRCPFTLWEEILGAEWECNIRRLMTVRRWLALNWERKRQSYDETTENQRESKDKAKKRQTQNPKQPKNIQRICLFSQPLKRWRFHKYSSRFCRKGLWIFSGLPWDHSLV